jgi:hypothetical protein
MTTALELTRSQILTFRRHVAALDERLPHGPQALQHVAWAGLQDSMPRAALLSIHARMAGTKPDSWEDPSLVQVWGPRFSAYVVVKSDLAVFTLGRLPDEPAKLKRVEDIAARLRLALAGRRMNHAAAARAMGAKHPNLLRYATLTGTLAIRWDGSHQPDIWNVPPPDIDPHEARLELARRYLHVFGPATPEVFAGWAGVGPVSGKDAFETLGKSLMQVRTPIGEAMILDQDEPLFHLAPGLAAAARLLPSGDTWFLLQGPDRELLVPDESQRGALWTSRVWPGALLAEGEIAGTWRRSGHVITIQPWRHLSQEKRIAVEAEAVSMPLPGIDRPMDVRWDDV